MAYTFISNCYTNSSLQQYRKWEWRRVCSRNDPAKKPWCGVTWSANHFLAWNGWKTTSPSSKVRRTSTRSSEMGRDWSCEISATRTPELTCVKQRASEDSRETSAVSSFRSSRRQVNWSLRISIDSFNTSSKFSRIWALTNLKHEKPHPT